ncbi:hypothetical protein [Halorubrum coriense]|uniref:hypothetical protein n=1 Tax=Halorubrum coriense TaxID=64713 RepID=UPI0012688A29|nr:hypothetical protein [Halorubrum coriense]
MIEYCENEKQLPDSLRGYIIDAIGEDETFRAAVKTTTGGFTETVWLVLTSEKVIIVVSKLIDATLESVPLSTVTEVDSRLVDLPDERRRELSIATIDETFTYELHDPNREFIDKVQTAVAAVPDPELTDPTHPTDVDHVIQNCERVVDAAESAHSEGLLTEASDQYETAISGYQTVLERLPADDGRRDAIQHTLRDLQTTHQQVVDLQARRETLRSRLTTAENSFQTAVRAHLEQRQTVAKIRYREARNGFENALDLLTTDSPVLVTPIEFAVEAHSLSVSGSLAEYTPLSTTTIEALSADEITTVADLQARTTGPTSTDDADTGPALTIDDLVETPAISQTDVPPLLALACQHTDSVSFKSRDDIQRRFEQALSGYHATV